MANIHLENGTTFNECDVVNIDEWCADDTKYGMPWLIASSGITICIVFASNESDALDEACDNDKLDSLQVSQESFEKDYESDEDSISYLGNASEMFDLSFVTVTALDNPKLSFTACYEEMMKEKETA